MFRVNEVLKFEGRMFRVLSLLGPQLVWIGLEDPKGFPSLVLVDDLVKAFEEEILFRVEDPHARLALEMPEQGSPAQTKRDANYTLIRGIVGDPEYYNRKILTARIKEVLETGKASKPHLYKLLRRYWQRGQTPNALLPDYKNSGGKGKKRVVSGKKLGRPRVFTPGIGATIDTQTERLFRMAIDKYLLKDKGCSFPYAHRRFKDIYQQYFPDIKESEMPTRRQMQHFYQREYQLPETLKKRKSRIEFNKDTRPLLSTAATDALGPGSRYEIDATIADIYLVSDSERRNIVGRPVVYFVMDVFSRMVAGFYVGFENPSYPAAIQALTMALGNKVRLCEEFGFEISEADWPAIGLPDAILADRGELLGHQIESLESSFSVRIENTPPYRGDAKGIVERNFSTIQTDFKLFAPGVVRETMIRKQGGRDYRLDAKLSIQDFKEIILSSVLMHNQFAVLERYDREPDMPVDLEMTPLSLWNWGIQHRTGRLRAASEDAIRISLLPRTKATISEMGVSVFGVYYTSPEVLAEGWLHRAREVRRPAGLQAAYDPACANIIYLFPAKNSTEYWTCRLTSRSREFADASFWDVWNIKNEQKKAVAKSKMRMETHKRHHEKHVAAIIAKAEGKAPPEDGMTKAERIRGIQTNREREKGEERRALKNGLQQNTPPSVAKTVPFKETKKETYDFPEHIDALFGDEDT
jgi:transposase InsO family protein